MIRLEKCLSGKLEKRNPVYWVLEKVGIDKQGQSEQPHEDGAELDEESNTSLVRNHSVS